MAKAKISFGSRVVLTPSEEQLMRFIRGTVIRMRAMKHDHGFSLPVIFAEYQQLPQEWVLDICFYRVWSFIEQQDTEAGQLNSIFSVGVDRVREFLELMDFPMPDKKLQEIFVNFRRKAALR